MNGYDKNNPTLVYTEIVKAQNVFLTNLYSPTKIEFFGAGPLVTSFEARVTHDVSSPQKQARLILTADSTCVLFIGGTSGGAAVNGRIDIFMADGVTYQGATGTNFVKVTTKGGIVTSGSAGPLAIADGGTGQTTATAAFNALSPSSAKGDLITNDGTNDVALAVGTNGQVLTADSAETTGLKWATPVTDGDKGDITVSGGVWTIDNDTVSFAKMQNITGAALIGRETGTGDPQSISLGTNLAIATGALDTVGASGTFTTADVPAKTVTVSNGIITSIV